MYEALLLLYDGIDFERTAFETKKAGTRISQQHNAETDSNRVPANTKGIGEEPRNGEATPFVTSDIDNSIPRESDSVKGEEKKYSLPKSQADRSYGSLQRKSSTISSLAKTRMRQSSSSC